MHCVLTSAPLSTSPTTGGAGRIIGIHRPTGALIAYEFVGLSALIAYECLGLPMNASECL